jgi:hypothetical protein
MGAARKNVGMRSFGLRDDFYVMLSEIAAQR